MNNIIQSKIGDRVKIKEFLTECITGIPQIELNGLFNKNLRIIEINEDDMLLDTVEYGCRDNYYFDINDVETTNDKVLKVRYLDKNLTKMIKIEKGDLVDLRASRIFTCNYNYETKKLDKVEVTFPYTYKQGETIFIKLGFAMKMPQGYKANVYPRSGTFANYGLLLTNSVGQIDNSYQGNEDEWCGMFYATREGIMNYDDRILQFEVVPQAMNNVVFDFVEELGDTNRGGYGSTGVK